MKPIYKNFDGLDISFQGALPEYILEQLRKAKQEAIEQRKSITIKLGKNLKIVTVAETGARGGYAFRFDTGFDGETWFIADNHKADRWNIRVSVKSLSLALYGYEKVKERLLSFLLVDLEAIGTKKPENEYILKERISRFDFCVDFETEHFEIDLKKVISHSKSKKKINDVNLLASGKAFESITIGKMPNKQLIIYNKLKEIKDNKKAFWWDIWNIKAENYQKKIWRVEARAGKKELDNWGLKRFKDFEEKAGDVILHIFNSVRYVDKNLNDTNQARWKNSKFWNDLIEVSKNNLFDYTSNAKREIVLTGIRKELENIFENNLKGSLRSYAALQGKDLGQLPEVIETIKHSINEDLKDDNGKILEKFLSTKNKYRLLN